MFTAIIGRFLKSVAAKFLERGTTIGLIECLLSGRTVGGATALPLSAQILHSVMLLLLAIWSMSPLGGQAALRVVSFRPRAQNTTTDFQYLDLMSSPSTIAHEAPEYKATYGNSIYAIFNAALSSPGSAKQASQDAYRNLRIPMIEPLAASRNSDEHGWYDLPLGSNVTYSSLTGLPYLGVQPNDKAYFNIKAATCILLAL